MLNVRCVLWDVRRGTWLLILRCSLPVLALVVPGCSDSIRKEVTGTVLLDDQPLAEGQIDLHPLPGTPGPSAGATIEDGMFRIDPDGGPLAGTFRVEITASRTTGKKIKADFSDEMLDVYVQYLPARYNDSSELEATVNETGATELKFELTSDVEPAL